LRKGVQFYCVDRHRRIAQSHRQQNDSAVGSNFSQLVKDAVGDEKGAKKQAWAANDAPNAQEGEAVANADGVGVGEGVEGDIEENKGVNGGGGY
jgi:hypothetical protein